MATTSLRGHPQTSAIPGPADRGIANEGQILMDALKAFITPIVKACLSAKDPHEASPNATPGNRDDAVLSALRTFVGEVVKAEIKDQGSDCAIPETKGDTARGDSLAKQEDLVIPVPPNESELQAAYETAAELLNRPVKDIELRFTQVIKAWQYVIFNQWPIRVLWIGKNGLYKLIGRSEAFAIIQKPLFHNLIHAPMDPDLQILMERPEFDLEALSRYSDKYFSLSILSHTWLQDLPGEITYKSWIEGTYDRNSAGYQKLESFCRVSASHGFQFGWMDTLCINKDSSSELDESIRSMYRWYKHSDACITYLAETSDIEDIHKDRWFTRGWTLQELVAPRTIFFYNRNWECFTDGENDRKDHEILLQIEKGSQIKSDELASFHERKPPISRRMQWAAGRAVTHEEDTAYSLMGLFDVSMSTAYGEGGPRTFARLIKKIIANPGRDTVAMDIINCAPQNHDSDTDRFTLPLNSVILPTHPSQFTSSLPHQELWQDFEPHVPMMITQRGLHVSALLIRGIDVEVDVHPRYTWSQEHEHSPYDLIHYPFDPKGAVVGGLVAVLNHTVKNNQVFLPRKCWVVITQPMRIDSLFQLEIPSDGSTFHILSSTYQFPVLLTNPEPIAIADLEENGLFLRTLYM